MLDKQKIARHFDCLASQRSAWFDRNRLYHDQVIKVCRLFLNPDSRVLELGSSTGKLLAALNPAYGVGVDISPESIALTRQNYPSMNWIHADVEALPSHPALAEPFDLIIMEDLVGYLWDIQQCFKDLKRLMHSRTRLIVSCWNWLWEPILRVAERAGVKAPDLDVRANWLSPLMLENLLELAGYEIVMKQPGILMPYQFPVVTDLINSLSYAPLVSSLVLSTVLVAHPQPEANCSDVSVSVIIPTRNEAGNIAALVERMPMMGTHTEHIFVDGNSTDGTVEEIRRHIALYPQRDIKFLPQTAARYDGYTSPNLMLKLGKGDAVRKGFAAASGDILMILDGDISVVPEDLPKFYEALMTSKARFANGTRFVYEQQNEAMQGLNRLGNVLFSLLFTWLLGQRITDSLCGTKALFKQDYEAIAANRRHFGDFDPFGDFDLLFGAARLGYHIVDVPIRYRARTYGASKVRVSKHGPLLARMSLIAFWHFKVRSLISWRGQANRKIELDAVDQNPHLRLNPIAITVLIAAVMISTIFHLRRKT